MRQGALAILPLAFGAALYGFAFGILAAQYGFPWWGVAAMSLSVHAGSSQIVAVDQLGAGGAVAGAALAGAALNLRYLGIGASVARLLRPLPRWQRVCAIHVTGDENWALTMSRRAAEPGTGASFLLGSGLVMITVWTTSTALGAGLGAALPDLESFGLGFAFTAAFIAMARGMWTGAGQLGPWALSFGTALVLARLAVPQAYAIVAGAGLGLLLCALRRRRAA